MSNRLHLNRLALSLVFVLLAGRQDGLRFGLGSAANDVRRAQGAPDVVERLRSLNVERWTFGEATVHFGGIGGAVTGWDDPSRSLKVALASGPLTVSREIGIGSSAADVVRLLGVPTAVRRRSEVDSWSYGASVVVLARATQRVAGWRQETANFPTRAADRGEAERVARELANPSAAPVAPDADLVVETPAELRVAAGGSTELPLTIVNRGTGTAFDVIPLLDPAAGGSASPLRADPAQVIGSLAPRGRATSRITVRADRRTRDTTIVIGIVVRSSAGVSAPARVTVQILAAPLSFMVLDEVRIDDQSGDGRLSPREFADVTVRLRSESPDNIQRLSATLALGPSLFAVAGTPPRFELGDISVGRTVDVTFSVYAGTRTDSLSLTLLLHSTEGGRDRSASVVVRLAGDRAVPDTILTGARTAGNRTAASNSAASNSAASNSATGYRIDEIDRDILPRAPRRPDAVAVIFGIDRYRSLPAARFAARDALTMRRYAVDALGVPDDREHLYLRLDADATGGEFRKVFGSTGWLSRQVQASTDLVVYFAGHGAASSRQTPLLLPWDADANYAAETAIELEEVYASLARLPARSITVVLDACLTGRTRDGAPLVAGQRPIVVSIEHPALVRDGMTVIAAARGAQTAGDLPDKRHGLFSYHLFRALRGAADGNGDGALSGGELDVFLRREVGAGAAAQDRQQVPLLVTKDTSRVVVRLRGASTP